MPELKLTEAEMNLFLMIKKKEMDQKNLKMFLEMFTLLLDKDFFICKSGKKIAHFDKDGKLRQIITEQIDWKG